MEHDFSGRSNGKFPGITERLKRQSCFPGWNVPTKIHVTFLQTSSLIPVADSLCKWEGFVQMVNATPERNITIQNFDLPIAQTVNQTVFPCKWKQPQLRVSETLAVFMLETLKSSRRI